MEDTTRLEEGIIETTLQSPYVTGENTHSPVNSAAKEGYKGKDGPWRGVYCSCPEEYGINKLERSPDENCELVYPCGDIVGVSDMEGR